MGEVPQCQGCGWQGSLREVSLGDQLLSSITHLERSQEHREILNIHEYFYDLG